MTHVHKAGRYLREQMSPWAIALLALITAVAFTIPFLFSDLAGASDGPAGEPTTFHGVQPDFKDGNPTECTFSDADEGFRINFDAEPTGTLTEPDPDNPDFEITLVFPSQHPPDSPLHDGPTFDFSVEGGVVEGILVKGGPNANWYNYVAEGSHTIDHDSLGADHDGAVVLDWYLHSPVNKQGNYFGVSHIDVCYNPTVTKSGTKFHDRDADGVDDGTGEEGLEGWTIKAFADDGNGVLDGGDTQIAETETGSDGSYRLELPAATDIFVCEVQMADWFQSAPDDPVCDSADFPALAPGGFFINLTADESGNDFGNFKNATKAGYKFHDLNANGEDDSEPRLEGWTINLVGTAGDGSDVNETTTTADDTGAYSFSVPPGTYTVSEVCPDEWRQSVPGPTTSEADCGNNVYNITLTSGQEDVNNIFGNFQNATKAGFKFKDADNNGVFDGVDTGLNDWTIVIYSDDGDTVGVLDSNDTKVDQVDTADLGNGDGEYEFSGLTPGDYIVCEVGQENWQQSAPTGTVCQSDPDGLGLADGGFAITLGSGDTDSDNDFGNTPLSDFDVRFFDLTGFTNATIECVDEDDNVIGSITTDDEQPETVLKAEDLLIGTYTCTIKITDP